MLRYSTVAAILLAAAIFMFDTLTPLDIAIAVLYVSVVLLSLYFTERAGTLLVGLACMGLTLLSFVVTHGSDMEAGPLARCFVSLAAIGMTTFLAMRLASTIKVIAQSERRYRTIFRATGVAILEMDFSALKAELDARRAGGTRSIADIASAEPDFVRRSLGLMRLVNANDTTLSTFGAPSIDAFRLRLASLVPPQMDTALWQLLDAIWQGQSRFEAESVMLALDGSPLAVLYTVAMPADREQLDVVLVSIMDVTARRKAEDGLHQAQTELAHVSRVATLGELTVSIAHEVNQPLAGVVTNGEAGLRWLHRPEPDLGEVASAIERGIADARRASEVIKRLRALSSKAAPQQTAIDINDLVQETLTLVQREMASHRIALKLALADGLPAVSGDRVQLQQVLINLVMNAIQAMSANGTETRELALAILAAEDGVSVEVSDTGPGFGPEDGAKLFNAFFTTKADGMGMGLPICRSIVEAHGGRLRATSPSGGGARFAFNLPSHQEA